MDRWCGRQEPEKVEGYLPTLRSFVNFFFPNLLGVGGSKRCSSVFLRIKG